eukprot:COSAG02_NODE_3862_length_6130_cov_2.580501_4_plen_74_part_00
MYLYVEFARVHAVSEDVFAPLRRCRGLPILAPVFHDLFCHTFKQSLIHRISPPRSMFYSGFHSFPLVVCKKAL